MTTKKTPTESLMEIVVTDAKRPWGLGWERLSPDQQEAELNSRLLITICAQDESIDPATIVRILREGRTWIIDRVQS
jgi:hypothetical protein